jgi:regulator of replication initiation timing
MATKPALYVDDLYDENQRLRAENEALRESNGELNDLYTTYRGLVQDGAQVADVIKAVRAQLAECRAENQWLRAALTEAQAWFQSILDNPDVLASTTAAAALEALSQR